MHFCLIYSFLVLGSLLETELLFCCELLKLRKKNPTPTKNLQQMAVVSIEVVKTFLFNFFFFSPVQNKHGILNIGVLVPSMCVLRQRLKKCLR